MKKRALILILCALISVSACVFSRFYVTSIMEKLNDMRLEAMEYSVNGQYDEAVSITKKMLDYVKKRSGVLEMLTPHEDLHDLIVALTDAYISLRIQDMDDYEKAITLFEENIRHLISHEAVSFSNIF